MVYLSYYIHNIHSYISNYATINCDVFGILLQCVDYLLERLLGQSRYGIMQVKRLLIQINALCNVPFIVYLRSRNNSSVSMIVHINREKVSAKIPHCIRLYMPPCRSYCWYLQDLHTSCSELRMGMLHSSHQ